MKQGRRAAGLLLLTAMLAGCGLSSSNEQETKPLQGKTLVFMAASHPWMDAIRPLLPSFEAETGIRVIVQSYFEDQLTQKLSLNLTSDSHTPDVFMYRPLQEGLLFNRNGWLEHLDNYVTKDTTYDWNDFSPQAVRSSMVDEKLGGIPVITEQGMLYYRKDLLREEGIPVPKTLDELATAAKRLHNPDKGVYGFVARGQRSPLVTQVSSFLYSEGGDFTDGRKATINTPAAIRAFELYGGLLRDYGPPDVINMSWPQAIAFFAEGKAAFYTDATSIYRTVTDPARSNIADKVGFAPFPAGSSGSRTYSITSWGLAMNPSSGQKEAAWAFIRWATSKEIVLATQAKGNTGARQSVWNSPEGTAAFPSELAAVIQGYGDTGVDHDRPAAVNVAEAREAVGEIVQRVMTGYPDIKQKADEQNAILQSILDQE
ncbi:ABC transporter substrate-binding protein [Paenibacillus herberti]|uniref:ABC transporter substrate-binding protein n=1 Tax=Paenibacillus herberti TaxID=1619309 RepID=A0A229P147_9BACL|nr:sugar ABC transporter substrate-binding protein [Paenibacillus herberti]OXM15922.1 ABC transporter substrate-binding protein [Paenibacillus herberti]